MHCRLIQTDLYRKAVRKGNDRNRNCSLPFDFALPIPIKWVIKLHRPPLNPRTSTAETALRPVAIQFFVNSKPEDF